MREARAEKAHLEAQIVEMDRELAALRRDQELQDGKHEELAMHVRHLREQKAQLQTNKGDRDIEIDRKRQVLIQTRGMVSETRDKFEVAKRHEETLLLQIKDN
jgi:hypothetical protein